MSITFVSNIHEHKNLFNFYLKYRMTNSDFFSYIKESVKLAEDGPYNIPANVSRNHIDSFK